MAEPPTAPRPDIAAADPPTPVAGWSAVAAIPGEPTDSAPRPGAPTDSAPRPGEPTDSAPRPGEPADITATPGEPVGAEAGPRRRRPNRWERPKPPHDWRFWVGGFGRLLIATGILLLGFVAYQLWGTGIETARAQRSLENDFEELLANAPDPTAIGEPSATSLDADVPTPVDTTAGAVDDLEGPPPDAPADADAAPRPEEAVPADADATPQTEAVPVDQQLIPLVGYGDALFRLEIPKIGTNDIVVAGVGTSDLKKGPGHYPGTPLPGQLGNSAVAGHRTTYGQPFHNVDKLEPGDEMIATTLSGTYVYVVTGQEIVKPSDSHVIATTDPSIATLTLTSCDPKWTAENRIVIHGLLDPARSTPVGEPVLNYGQPVEEEAAAAAPEADTATTVDSGTEADTADDDAGLLTEVDAGLVGVDALTAGAATAGSTDAFAEGWFSDSDAYAQVALWAAALIAIWAGAYLLARHFRRTWVGLAVGVLPFLVALFFFYQNVNRLLPPNL